MSERSVAVVLRDAGVQLESVGGSGRLDATLLLEHVTGARRESFLIDDARELDDAEFATFTQCIERRLAGEPVAYIVGTAGFYGRTFAVDARALVPRPETELVIEAAVADVRGRGKTSGKFADIGTGSGAIAITLSAEIPDAWVFGTDVSRDAISLARRNAARNNVFQQCTFLVGDLAAPLGNFAPFDLIVANLPYIPSADVPAAPDPVSFEPRVALDGGPDGLDLYRRLISQLPGILAPGATVFFEAAPGTIEPLAALVEAAFPHAHVEIGTDYAELERFVQFTLAE
jgi:release factor glutamine methyltransferase